MAVAAVVSMEMAHMAATAAPGLARAARHTKTSVGSVAKATFVDRRTGVAVAVVVLGRQVLLQFLLVAQAVAVVRTQFQERQPRMRVVVAVVVGRVAAPVAHRRLAVLEEAAVVEQVERRRGTEVGAPRQMDRTGPTGSVVAAVEVRTATTPLVEAVRVRAAPAARESSSFAMHFLQCRFRILTLLLTTARQAVTTSRRIPR